MLSLARLSMTMEEQGGGWSLKPVTGVPPPGPLLKTLQTKHGFAIVIAQKWSLSNLRDAGWMPCPV
jgi:hypothetical protein